MKGVLRVLALRAGVAHVLQFRSFGIQAARLRHGTVL